MLFPITNLKTKIFQQKRMEKLFPYISKHNNNVYYDKRNISLTIRKFKNSNKNFKKKTGILNIRIRDKFTLNV